MRHGRRCTASTACCTSLRSPLRNLSRAGVAKNRSRTSTGPRRMRGGGGRRDAAALDGDRPGFGRVRLAAGDGQPADGTDRRQRLAAEAEGRDAQQVVVGQLGSRGARLPAPARRASCRRRRRRRRSGCGRFRRHLDARGAGIDGVLDQLLDRGGRALDHLAGGDAVDHDSGRRRIGMARSLDQAPPAREGQAASLWAAMSRPNAAWTRCASRRTVSGFSCARQTSSAMLHSESLGSTSSFTAIWSWCET